MKRLVLSALATVTMTFSAPPLPPTAPAATNPATTNPATTTPAQAALRAYRCLRAPAPITLDGRGTDPAWAAAPWTDDFVDIARGPEGGPPEFRTRAKLLWDDTHLYLYAELHEPHVRATLTERNTMIYRDNALELFLDPDGDRRDYYEFEINALGTVMELTLPKPYKDGGHYTFITSPNLRTAVHIDGTLNDPSDTDRGWSVEAAIPFADLAAAHITGIPPTPPFAPTPGTTWRLNFNRVQWPYLITDNKYAKPPRSAKREDNWVWSPQGAVDMHKPEMWGHLEFVR